MDSQGLQGHLSRARDGHKQLHRNNVLFDTLLPSGRKGDDSQRKHTNLFFMLGLFTQRSHPYFHPSLSVSHCLRSFLSPSRSLIFSKGWFDDLICACVCVCVENLTLGVLHREPAPDKHTHVRTHLQLESHAASLSHLCMVGTPGPGCLIRTSWHHWSRYHPPSFLPTQTHHTVPMHSWLQMLTIKSCWSLCETLLEGPFLLPLSHLLTSCQLTSPLP